LPEIIAQQIRDYLGIKGHAKITLNEFLRKEDGTHFSKVHLHRKLTNGKTISRPWIIYSESEDKMSATQYGCIQFYFNFAKGAK